MCFACSRGGCNVEIYIYFSCEKTSCWSVLIDHFGIFLGGGGVESGVVWSSSTSLTKCLYETKKTPILNYWLV
jgi:hypothetical protein